MCVPAPSLFLRTQLVTQSCVCLQDKPRSIEEGSLIVVVKTGEAGRPFKLEWLDGTVIFEEVLPPGTAVVMTLEANLRTKHSVPELASECASSGSLVARTITESKSWTEVLGMKCKHAQKRPKHAADHVEEEEEEGSDKAAVRQRAS